MREYFLYWLLQTRSTLGIGRAMWRVGHGVFEIASDLNPELQEFNWMGTLSRETGLDGFVEAFFHVIRTSSASKGW